MAADKGLSNTLRIIDAAASVLSNDKTKKVVGQVVGTADRLSKTGSAITSFSGQTTILSRVFIDESVITEPILPNLMRSIHEWYAAQIISALHLSQMVDSHRTVQDVLSVVQSGHNQRERGVLGNITTRSMGMESFISNYSGNNQMGLEASNSLAVVPQKKEATSPSDKDMSIRSVSTSDNRIGPMGELYEVKLSNPNKEGSSLVIPIFIQMQPSIVPAPAAPRFVDMNVSPSLWQRWTQMRSGELTFWKDFILQRDRIRRNKTVLKDPQLAEAFTTFLKTVAKKDKYALDDASDRLGARQSSNLANSVIIFSEDTIAQAKADSGIDLHNERDRDRYFKDTYTMILVIVDPLHQRITIYFNGLDGEINSSYNEFKPKDSKFDPQDFMTILQAFSTGNISRMR